MERLVRREVTLAYISGAALVKQREAAGLSQAKLAEAMGFAGATELIAHQRISEAESAFETAITRETAVILLKILERKEGVQ